MLEEASDMLRFRMGEIASVEIHTEIMGLPQKKNVIYHVKAIEHLLKKNVGAIFAIQYSSLEVL